MPHCMSCSAPLPAYSSRCEYCGTKNDVDLRGVTEFTIANTSSNRRCPLCNRLMETIGISTISEFYIERCPDCMGLFFDPEELNALLDNSVNQVYTINLQKIHAMNQMPARAAPRTRAYINCPVCGELMNRINFATRSGVVVDQCKHGIWLDSGGLRKLLEWRKAGGKLYHEKVQSEREKQKQREEDSRRIKQLSGGFTVHSPGHYGRDYREIDLTPTIASAAKLIWRLFR